MLGIIFLFNRQYLILLKIMNIGIHMVNIVEYKVLTKYYGYLS